MKKEYWIGLAVFCIMPCLLYVVISQPWGFDAIGKEESPKIWIGFWGGYLGAAISAIVAFTVLNKQIKQNKQVNDANIAASVKENEEDRKANQRENEENRKANQIENENNRKLQIQSIKFKQEKDRLGALSVACNDYAFALDCNELIYMSNCLKNDRTEEFKQTAKILLDAIPRYQAKIKFLLPPERSRNEAETTLFNTAINYGNIYQTVVNDLQTIEFYNNVSESKLNAYEILNSINASGEKLSDQLTEFINKMHKGAYVKNPPYNIILITSDYVKSFQLITMLMQDASLDFLYAEEARINTILPT